MKKQGALALLLGVPKGEKGDASGDLTDAARDILDAIKDDDAESLALALERAIGSCSCGGCEEYEDDSEEE